MEKREYMRIVELNFLSELFVLCRGDVTRGFSIYDIGRGCGCSLTETKQIAEKLSDLDLLMKDKPALHEVSITQKGIDLMKGERTVNYSAPIY